MATGSSSGVSRTFFSIGFGKLRQKSLPDKTKVTKDTVGAVCRKTQSGSDTWALEEDWIDGKIENIYYKEDKEYGDSFEIQMSDVDLKYQVSFKEDSRFWTDFMQKLPKIDFSKDVKINPYDYEKDGKNVLGCSVSQNQNKITSYYKDFVDSKWVYQNGFPAPASDMDWKDKDELKIYGIKVKKFLRKEFNEKIAPIFAEVNKKQPEFQSSGSVAKEVSVEVSDDSDLPF